MAPGSVSTVLHSIINIIIYSDAGRVGHTVKGVEPQYRTRNIYHKANLLYVLHAIDTKKGRFLITFTIILTKASHEYSPIEEKDKTNICSAK